MDMHADPEDIVQVEEDYGQAAPVQVVVGSAVETRELPAVRAGYRTESGVTALVGVKLLAFEPRRKSAVVIAQSGDLWLSISQAGAQAGAAGAARLPVGVPLAVGHLDEVWACAVTDSTDVSVLAEYWTE
jgi:hypothetical protein